MTIRILLFLIVSFVGLIWTLRAMQIPVDGFLAFLFFLVPLVLLLFAHYRWIGRLRTLGLAPRALWHLGLWRLLLPSEAYWQMKLSILVEGNDPQAAREAIEKAEAHLPPPFLLGFHAELSRREGNQEEALNYLELALEETPPGLLRTGILAQMSRLLLQQGRKSQLGRVEEMLEEAGRYVTADEHKRLLAAIEGELFLKQGRMQKAAEALQTSLDSLVSTTPPPTSDSLLDRMGWSIQYWFAQLTYSQQDEHQFPLYAEFYLSLGRAYEGLGEREKALDALRKGLSLCKQPFVEAPIESALKSLSA